MFQLHALLKLYNMTRKILSFSGFCTISVIKDYITVDLKSSRMGKYLLLYSLNRAAVRGADNIGAAYEPFSVLVVDM